jgi:hypothetical protein
MDCLRDQSQEITDPHPCDRVGFLLQTRRFREDEDALSHIIEFSFSLIIVLFILAGYFTAVDSEFIIHSPDDSKRQDECIRYSELLIGDSGMARSGVNNTTTHWENLDAQTLAGNLTRPGFALENARFGIISEEKISGLRNITYKHLLAILPIKNYNLNIEVIELNGSAIAFFGYSHEGARKVSETKRIVLLNGSERDRPVSFIFRLFEGVNRRTLVIVNEFMYLPEEGKNEWVELYNPSDEAVNLSTFAFYSQIGQTFRDHLGGETLILPGNGYGLILDDGETTNQYNVSSGTLTFYVKDDYIGKGGLSDKGMDFFFQGETFRSQNYSYNETLGANGNGKTLEWSYLEGGWKESAVIGGTPGRENSVR